MRALLDALLLNGAFFALLTVSCCSKKERAPVVLPALPAPLAKGQCWDIVDVYEVDGYWRGSTACMYQGWWWDCPTNGNNRSCTRRPNGQITPEKVL